MPHIADRVKETGTVSGTGSVTLAGAASADFRAFSAAFAAGTVVWYAIQTTTPGSWEVGYGTLTNSTTLTRDFVESSSNGGSLVNFATSSAVHVFCTAPADLIADAGYGRQVAQSIGLAMP